MQRCEDCKFIRIAEDMEEDMQLKFATCKASSNRATARISRVWDKDEYLCSAERIADTCKNYEEKDHD